MTLGKHHREEIPVEEIRRLVRETMLNEEEITRNLNQLVRILQLFEEIDAFEEQSKFLEPLYHPLDQQGEPRRDEEKEEKTNLEDFTENVKDSFLRVPRL